GLCTSEGFKVSGGGIDIACACIDKLLCFLVDQVSAVNEDNSAILPRDTLRDGKADALGRTRDDDNLIFKTLRGENPLLIGGAANWHRHLNTDLYCNLFSLFGNLFSCLSCTRLLVSVEFFIVEIQRWGVMSIEVLAHGFDHWWWSAQVGVGFAFS